MDTNKSYNFCHLHNHSYYSLLDGLSSPEDLVSCASDLGYKALALTDHGSCAGLFHFQKACKKSGIKPILGMETYITENHKIKEKITVNGKEITPPTYHLILIAKNKIGYKNLIRLSSKAYIDGFYYKARMDFNLLEQHKEGLIVTSACIGGEIPYLLWINQDDMAEEVAKKYQRVFGDDFYLEIMTHSYNEKAADIQEREKTIARKIYKLAKKLGIKAICTQDTHYARKEDWEAHDILLSIQTLDCIQNPDRMTFNSDDFYLKPYEQMADLYKKAPELLTNTIEIANKVEEDLIVPSKDLLPNFDLPDGFENEEEYLKELVTNGMKEKGLISEPKYRERAQYEMSVITKCNYTKYFLILWDIINFAKNEGVRVGIGRGSAVSSLCLYVLGITKLDPLKYDLIFERFLNPDRISPPDVDLDFDYDRREEVYNYIIKKYGADYCSQIGTYNKLQARQAIRSTVKALDLGNDWKIMQDKKAKNPNIKVAVTKYSLDLADRISKLVPFKAGTKIQGAMKSVAELRMAMHKYPKLMTCVLKIEGTLKSAGVHPAGILVCKDPVIEHIPLRSSKGVICSQFDGPEVEYLGLLKFDLLALSTLTVVDKTIKMIKQRHKKDIDIDTLEPNDPNVFKILNGEDPRKDTRGVFQFEANGISRLLAAIHVDRFEDMIVANALYRPGPLGAGVHDMYCNYKHGRKPIEYLHPKMGEALRDTYGIMIFQENIMKVAQVLASFTGAQADTLRKAMGKKIPELLAQQKEMFVKGCVKNSISKDIAEKIFAQIDYFSGYGFNKCLSGDTTVYNKIDNKIYTLEELANGSYGLGKQTPVVLDSYLDGNIVEDNLVEVFETGEKEVYEIELDNGMTIKSTLDHKFYCSDGNPHTVKEIMEYNLEILYETNKGYLRSPIGMLKSKIKSFKLLGKRKTYNVTMKSNQHNYAICDPTNGLMIITSNSHSAAYAFLAYQTAWLKQYYPIEFMCNLLTGEINDEDKLKMYLDQADRMGIICMPEDINKSGLQFKIQIGKHSNGRELEVLRKPLVCLKGVGSKAVKNIVDNQPFASLEDFLARIDSRLVNSAVFKTLVKSGCMKEAFNLPDEVLLNQYDEVKKKIDKNKKSKQKQKQKMDSFGGASLFDSEPQF